MIETRTIQVKSSSRDIQKAIDQHTRFGWRVVATQAPPSNMFGRPGFAGRAKTTITFERENDDTSGMYPFRPPTIAPEAPDMLDDLDAAIARLVKAGYTVTAPTTPKGDPQ